MPRSYSIFGWHISTSLYFQVVAVIIFALGTRREILSMRRTPGRPVPHLLRILAYLLTAAFFVVVPRLNANSAHWSLVLTLALLVTAVVIFIATGRAAGITRATGKHGG